jgi:hypothetical protein
MNTNKPPAAPGGAAGPLWETYLPGFLGGLPLPGTSRIASRADAGYMVPVVIGSTPDLSRRFWTVLYGKLRMAAISAMVSPSIFIFYFRQKKCLFYEIFS